MADAELPRILQAHVSLFLPIVIPDLLTNAGILRPEYQFLLSASEYAHYYKEHERDGRDTSHQAHIPALCAALTPLKKRHTLRSYWKVARRLVEEAPSEGKDLSKLLYFLPLEVHIPTEPLAVNGKKYPADAYAYVFPFGCCIVNLDVQVSDMTFREFTTFINKLTGANIVTRGGLPCPELSTAKNRGAFKNFANEITRIIAAGLFQNPGDLNVFRTHTLIFIKKAEPAFSVIAKNHKIAIAAALSGKSFEDMAIDGIESLDEHLKNRISGKKPQELLFFSIPGTVIIASPYWDVTMDNSGPDQEKIKAKKLDKKMMCMKCNYQSCLNALFAVNRVLAHTLVKEKHISPARLDDFRNSIGMVFPEEGSNFQFRYVYEKVAPEISLKDNIRIIR